MAFPELPPEEMRAALDQIDQALFSHEIWHENFIRTVICRLPPDQQDLDEQAHRKCRFGQWLYGEGAKKLSSHPSFMQIEAAHSRMHQLAAQLLTASAKGERISLNDYERFVNALKQLRLEILTTKHELEDAVYNLDPLTGAASRIGMLTKLREQQALVQRKVHFTCIAMLDLDHFKKVNDAYGHAVGDRVLVAVARFILKHQRPYDMLFRYGGEEFLLCAPNADLDRGRGMVERLRQGIQEMPIEIEGRKPFHVTISAGLTLLDPDVPVEESIRRADKALYVAKSTGRNRVVVWDPTMT